MQPRTAGRSLLNIHSRTKQQLFATLECKPSLGKNCSSARSAQGTDGTWWQAQDITRYHRMIEQPGTTWNNPNRSMAFWSCGFIWYITEVSPVSPCKPPSTTCTSGDSRGAIRNPNFRNNFKQRAHDGTQSFSIMSLGVPCEFDG